MRKDDLAIMYRDDVAQALRTTFEAVRDTELLDAEDGDALAEARANGLAWRAVALQAAALLSGEDWRAPGEADMPPPQGHALRTPFDLAPMERAMLRDQGLDPDDFVGFSLQGEVRLGVMIRADTSVLLVELACPLPTVLVEPLQGAVSRVLDAATGQPSVNAEKLQAAMPVPPSPRYLIPRTALSDVGRAEVERVERFRFDAPAFFAENAKAH
jgi:hypothetical protein